MIATLGALLCFAVVVVSGGSAVRKGVLSRGAYRALLALLVAVVAAVAFLALRAASTPR